MATRVFQVSTRVKGEVIPLRRIHLYDADSPHSSDRWFTEWGEPEREIFYDYPYERIQKAYLPVECGDRIALFDGHHNPTRKWVFYTEKRSVCVDNKKREEITETKEIERFFENSYDEKGRLIQKVEHYRSNESDRKPFARTYTTAFEYDERNRVIKTVENDNWAIICTFDDDNRLVSKEWLSIYHAHNLFESGERYEKGYSETYKYDEGGNLVEVHHTTEPDSHFMPIERLERMEYDAKGALVRKVVTIEDGLEKKVARYTYKNNSWCYIQIKHKPMEEKSVSCCVSTMDEHGNVIRKESRSKKYKYWKKKDVWKLDHYFVTRNIEYYT